MEMELIEAVSTRVIHTLTFIGTTFFLGVIASLCITFTALNVRLKRIERHLGVKDEDN